MITKNNAQQLFQALTLTTTGLSIFSALAVFLIFGVRYTVAINIGGAVASYAFYRWSLTENYQRAIHIYTAVALIYVFLLMYVTPTIETTVLIALPILFIHLLYDTRTTLIYSVACLILLTVYNLAYVNVHNPFPMSDFFIRNLFTVCLIGIMIVSTVTRNQNERNLNEKTKALEESERHFRNVINNSVMIIGLFHINTGVVTYLNRSTTHGYDLTKYKSVEDWAKIIIPEDRHLLHDAFQKLMSGTQETVAQVELRMKEGDFPLEIVTFYISLFERTPEGYPHCLLVSAQIVTEQRLAEQNRLELAVQQQKVGLMNDLVLAFSHEFRTPLSSIEMNLHLLQRQFKTPQTEVYFGRARLQIERLERLIKQLTFTMRLEQTIELDVEPINIASLLRQLVDVTQSAAPDSMEVRLNFENETMMICGDHELLTNTLQQLLNNALKYTPEDGQITVGLVSHNDGAVISIKDTGSGIPTDVQSKLFERFSRADRHRNKEGLGLGLYIVKKIIEAHSGTVTLTSTPGQGTEVRLNLMRTPKGYESYCMEKLNNVN